MIKSILIILAILIGLLVAPYWSGHTGYVMIQIAGYTLETSVLVAAILLTLIVASCWFALAVVRRVLFSKLWTQRWFKKRRRQKAIRYLRLALDAWLNKDFQASAAYADKSKKHYPDPNLAYAFTAAAYGEAGANDEQQRVLTEAALAGLHSATLDVLRLLSSKNADEVLQLSQAIGTRKKLTPGLWRAIAEQLARFELWDALRPLLPQLEQQKAMPAARLHKLKRLCFHAYFRHQLSLSALEKQWKGLTKAQRRDPAIRIAYIEVLVIKGHQTIAAKVAERGLKRHELNLHDILALSPELWALDESLQQWVAKEVKANPENIHALQLYAATRFLLKEYDLAEQALREALRLHPEQYAYQLLGETLLAAGKPEGALQAFRKASGQGF